MKLVVAIVQDEDAIKLVESLGENKFGVTKLATTGGFLKSGNTTLIIGTPKEEVDEVIAIIEENCKSRTKMTTANTGTPWPNGSYVPYPVEVKVGGATIFVLDVEQFEKI